MEWRLPFSALRRSYGDLTGMTLRSYVWLTEKGLSCSKMTCNWQMCLVPVGTHNNWPHEVQSHYCGKQICQCSMMTTRLKTHLYTFTSVPILPVPSLFPLSFCWEVCAPLSAWPVAKSPFHEFITYNIVYVALQNFHNWGHGCWVVQNPVRLWYYFLDYSLSVPHMIIFHILIICWSERAFAGY